MYYRKRVDHIVGLALTAILLAGCNPPSAASTPPMATPTPVPIHLEADGSGDYTTLEEAVQAAPSGASIFLGAGTYRLEGPLDIEKPLRLLGAGADETEIVCEAEGHVVRFASAGTFAAEEITFRHEGDAVADVVVVEQGEIEIRRCHFTGAVSEEEAGGRRSGLLIKGETTGIVEGCSATENGDGICAVESAQVTLVRNLCADNEIGITFSGTSGGIARDNMCFGNYAGIEVSGAAQPTLQHNFLNYNETGGIVYSTDAGAGGVARLNQCSENGAAGIVLLFGSEPTLERNICTDNIWAGIYYTDSSGGRAFQNECSGGDHGIEVGGQAHPTLEQNLCTDNEMSGIYYWQEAGGIAQQNVCWGNSDGISALDSSQPLLEENICVESAEACIYVERTADPDLVDNDCRDSETDVVDERQPQISTGSPPTGTVVSEILPASASLGDTWVRPIDGTLMAYVPGGEFRMGSESSEVDQALQLCREYHDDCYEEDFSVQLPMHSVTVDSIWIDQYEVTNGQYHQCVTAGSCEPPDESLMPHELYYGDSAFRDYPVVSVNWYQALDYCVWAGARLPTEAEWEYAARGPEQRTYPWGDEFDGERLNYADASCRFDFVDWADDAYDDGYPFMSPTGSYPGGVSWCGAFDMAGNVWEWTADWLGEYPSEPLDNPQGPFYGEARIMRGGCWACDRGSARTAHRNWAAPSAAMLNIGFRCASSVPASE